jgi:hypothetical protein
MLLQSVSRRTDQAAKMRMRMVTGSAAIVRPNSTFGVFDTMTRNWTVKPTKKKKSNLRMAM